MSKHLLTSIAVFIAAVFIASAFYITERTSIQPNERNLNTQESGVVDDARKVNPISNNDHILGNPEADIIIVEYADIECPFCKQFHITMRQIIEEYGPSGQVAWVFRHFPFVQIHPNSPRLAEASECVAELAGEGAFWNFIDEIYSTAPGNSRFPMENLTETAEKVGANGNDFDVCLESGKYKEKVQSDFDNAIATGGKETPHNIVMIKNGNSITLPGAQTYATVKNVIEVILTEKGL